MAHKIHKPDFYTVLNLRRSSVALKLATSGIRTKKALKAFLEASRGQYGISELFLQEANEYVDACEADKEAYLQSKTTEAPEVTEVVDEEKVEAPTARKSRTTRKKRVSPKKSDEKQ